MKRILVTTAAIVAFALPAVAQQSQFVANAGLSPAQAQGMSLTEIAAAKFNRDTGTDNHQTVIAAQPPVRIDPDRHGQLIAAAKMSPDAARGLTLAEVSVVKHNVGTDGDQWIRMSSRGPIATVPGYFVTASGLSPEAAQGMTLNQIYAAKLEREGHGNYDQ